MRWVREAAFITLLRYLKNLAGPVLKKERERLFEERLEHAEFDTRENFWEAREEYRRETCKEVYGDDFNPDVYNPDTVVMPLKARFSTETT